LNENKIDWDLERFMIRQILGNCHKTDDKIIDFSKYNDGKTEFNIIQKRDIYENYNGEQNYFFLNYDEKELLKEIEIHNGIIIIIDTIKLAFETNYKEAVLLLKNISKENKKISDGEYMFKDLKIVITDGISMGGDSKELSYFYCSKNIDHLNK
jgi:hypothetical protein